ncbi:hypothetical protein [Algirhabdus cladophorae]|uniref:hypothetical protein n=1 Tax=Algirhabdus cladophorae TaxID=3377108 RepID=UPI003B84B5B5
MFTVTKSDVPSDALLQRYAQRDDCFTDCFYADIAAPVTLEAYVMAFYRTWLFRTEKWILDRTIKRPSGIAELTALASGRGNNFSAWSVEQSVDGQLLLDDLGSRTRSWLMVAPQNSGTRLYFGSAVVPVKPGQGLGFAFRALLGFHNLYSYALLGACARDLRRQI